MTIIYFRSPHTPETLNERFEALFKKADIIFLEQAARDAYQYAYDHYNQLSKTGHSTITANEMLYQEFKLKKEYFIRGSGKPIEIEKSPFTTEEIRMPMEMMFWSFWDFNHGNFANAYSLKLDSAHCSADINSARDLAIGKQLEKLQVADSGKDILALMGGAHEFQIYLNNKGLKVKQEFPYMPYPFGFEDQIERSIIFGKTPSRETVARSFVSNIVGNYLMHNGIGPPDSITGEIKTAEQLSYEDVEALSKHLGTTNRRASGSKEVAIAWLENRGITIHHK